MKNVCSRSSRLALNSKSFELKLLSSRKQRKPLSLSPSHPLSLLHTDLYTHKYFIKREIIFQRHYSDSFFSEVVIDSLFHLLFNSKLCKLIFVIIIQGLGYPMLVIETFTLLMNTMSDCNH